MVNDVEADLVHVVFAEEVNYLLVSAMHVVLEDGQKSEGFVTKRLILKIACFFRFGLH
jgi:hypothetical protein